MPFARAPKLDAVLVYLAVRCLGAIAFAMYAVVASVYRIVEAGLSPLKLILVGTVLEVSTFVFEIPTGVVSDVYSRRLSLIVGAFLVGAGFIVEGLFPGLRGGARGTRASGASAATFGSGARAGVDCGRDRRRADWPSLHERFAVRTGREAWWESRQAWPSPAGISASPYPTLPSPCSREAPSTSRLGC